MAVEIQDTAETIQIPVKWAGGKCPVAPLTLVKVQCAFETEFDHSQMPCRAQAWADNWRRDPAFPQELAITHYVVVESQ
ncbi:hypothetical protein [Sphingomonas sp. BE137]|uniref:hypothetical protein n=1 Tax=Sphingomonas sp. BE137 TaxID=2817844 RepID=UPI001AEA7280|nr:hypothetical protein [Sphingomonas sp. BE137]MDR6850162.1 hypothetical protein [Sphingomonas sp. BE137]